MAVVQNLFSEMGSFAIPAMLYHSVMCIAFLEKPFGKRKYIRRR